MNAEVHERWADAPAHFEELADAPPVDTAMLPERLCRALMGVLPVDGAALSVGLGSQALVPLAASDALAADFERLEFTLGQGPILSAIDSGHVIQVDDLDCAEVLERWPAYTSASLRRSPLRAVYSFPWAPLTLLGPLGRGVGSLSLFAWHPRTLPPSAVAAAADISIRIYQRLQNGHLFERFDDDPWANHEQARNRRTVFTAQGMTMTANGISGPEALALLRAQAWQREQFIEDLAHDILARHLDPSRT